MQVSVTGVQIAGHERTGEHTYCIVLYVNVLVFTERSLTIAEVAMDWKQSPLHRPRW